MNSKTFFLIFPFSFFIFSLVGCGHFHNTVRSITHEEIAKANARSYVTSTNVIGPYSPAVISGNMVFVSGQIGLNEKMEFAGDSIEAQTHQVFKNMFSVLAKAGCDSADVVSCTVYLKDMKEFPKMNAVYSQYFVEGKYPARATVEVANLPKNARVEISCIAFKK